MLRAANQQQADSVEKNEDGPASVCAAAQVSNFLAKHCVLCVCLTFCMAHDDLSNKHLHAILGMHVLCEIEILFRFSVWLTKSHTRK